jgi:hypothetical protein
VPIPSHQELRRDSGPLSGIPDIRSLIPKWHLRAACRDEADEGVFFQEHRLFSQHDEKALAGPKTLLAVLTCETCPVRRPCLEAGLTPYLWNVRDDDKRTPGRNFGVWAGTVELDRHKVKHLPFTEQIEVLERGFDSRLEQRLSAYTAARTKLRPVPNQPGNFRPRNLQKADKRIDELLARRVTAARPLPASPRTNCGRCSRPLGWRKRSDAKWCSSACRQAAYRRAA